MSEIRQLIWGSGAYPRRDAPEPLLLPLAARHVPPAMASSLCHLTRQFANLWTSVPPWSVLGDAAAEAIANRHHELDDQQLKQCVDALPNLVAALLRAGESAVARGQAFLAHVGDAHDLAADPAWALEPTPLAEEWTADRLVEGCVREPGWLAAAVASLIAGTDLSDQIDVSEVDLEYPWGAHVRTLLTADRARSALEEISRAFPYTDELTSLAGDFDTNLWEEVLDAVFARWLGEETAAPDEDDDQVFLGIDDQVDSAVAGAARSEGDRVEIDTEDELPDRRLHRQVFVTAGGARVETRGGFVAGCSNEVRLWIGPDTALDTGADQRLDEPDPSPEEQAQGWLDMEVVFIWGEQTKRDAIQLPVDKAKPSNPVSFDVDVPKEGTPFVSADVYVLHEGAVVQLLELGGVVVASHADAGPGITLKAKALVRSLPDAPRSAAVATAMTQRDGELIEFGPRGVARYSLAGAGQMISEINNRVFNATKVQVRKSPETRGTDWLAAENSEVLQLLQMMAAQGNALFDTLAKQGLADLADPIQFVNLDPADVIPIEYVYDKGLPVGDMLKLCDRWEQASADGLSACPCDLQPFVQTDTICPLGFWALSKRIERHERRIGGVNGDFAAPSALTSALPEIQAAMLAASARVDGPDVELVEGTLEELVPGAHKTAGDWEEWVDGVAGLGPQLLVLMPHHGSDANLKLDYLEIGSSSDDHKANNLLYQGALGTSHVAGSGGPGPVVLLLGCKTGAGDASPVQSFALDFQAKHASIVVATLASILGQHAAPVAAAFVREMAAAAAMGAPFSHVMRDIRRRMFADGYLMALALVSFGDGDWKLTHAGRT